MTLSHFFQNQLNQTEKATNRAADQQPPAALPCLKMPVP
jgi:hypothetical protein